MKRLTNKSGFTLIEIIVVLIIVGILAAIALPNLFSNVQKTRGEEALATISSFRPNMEACIMKNAGATESTVCCAGAAPCTLSTPTSSSFTYTVTPPAGATGTGYAIKAAGTGAPLQAGSTLTVTRAAGVFPATGAVTCAATSELLGAC